MLHTQDPLHILAREIHDSDLDAIKANAETWEIKDGFPCTHRRPKRYLLDATLTFIKLHQRYKAKIEASNDGACVISCLRWIQYVHLFYLGLHLTHSVEDVCDCCVRIDIQRKHDDLLANKRNHLLMEKETYLDIAIT